MIHLEALLREWVSGLYVAGATLGCLWLLLAAIAVLRFSRSVKLRSNSLEPMTILKPLRDTEPGTTAAALKVISEEAYFLASIALDACGRLAPVQGPADR